MLKKTLCLVIGLLLILNSHFAIIYGAQNPSHEEVESIIEEVAKEKNIPDVILKAIAWKESNYRQFDKNGNPFVSYGNTGIMQINKVHKHLDQNLLKNDIRYNIEAGANLLLAHFNAAGKRIPKVGDMNPQILENWYFPLWAYNGWSSKNNPNVSGSKAYQEQIFQLIRTRYNQPVTSISASLLPKQGLPVASLHINTPEPYHDMGLKLATNIDVAQANQPVVSRSGGRRAVFQDIVDHPKREYIEALYHKKIISGVGNNKFAPDDPITREQAAKIIVEALDLDLVPKKVEVKDWSKVSSWARDYISTLYHNGLMQGDNTGIRPKDFLTREEILVILYRAIGNNRKANIHLNYADTKDISSWSMDSIKYFTESKVLTMNEKEKLRPKSFATRGEVSEFIAKIIMP